MSDVAGRGSAPQPSTAWYNDEKIRGYVFQGVLFVIVVWLFWWLINNTVVNMKAQGRQVGFGFLWDNAGFDISQKPIAYATVGYTYFRAFLVGLVNTLIAAALGIVIATVLGFLLGIARLSPNWLLAKMATVYVEIIRNIPPVLQLLIWATVARVSFPDPRDSFSLGNAVLINKRGIYFPTIEWGDLAIYPLIAFVIGVVGAIVFSQWAKRRQEATGQRAPVLWVTLGLVIGLPLLVFLACGMPATMTMPEKTRFDVKGSSIGPEIFVIVIGLGLYTAAFIAEIVRGGIRAVSHGQTEAARALGLSGGHTMRLVVLPQAIRVIIPPLTNQYLNLTKNTSLGNFVGYPDLTLVTTTILNQTSRDVESMAIMMAVYLTISLLTALLMNWFNARVALVER